MFTSLSGHVVAVDAVVRYACGCVEDRGRVAFAHPDEKTLRAHMIHRLVAWHDHGADLSRVVAHASALETDVLHEFLKLDAARQFVPKVVSRCAQGSCASPHRGLIVPPHLHLPPIFGGAPSFVYAGKSITTNRVHGAGIEPIYLDWGIGSGTHANTDTALFSPSAEARATGTASLVTTNANFPLDTWKLTGTMTANATRAITEAACFDVSTKAPATTVSTAISSASTGTLVVTAATGFPGAGNYDIQVLTEVMTVTAGQGTTSWTVTRGAHGATALASIASGSAVVGGVSTAGGNGMVLADFAVINLNSGDSISFTITLQYT